eukprot:scaffold125483_cov35-Attheya_sp.AAC.1
MPAVIVIAAVVPVAVAVAVVPVDRPNASANTLATLCSPPSALCTFWVESSCGAPSLPQLPGSS